MVERVVEGGHERDRRDDVVAQGVRRHGRADTEQDDADVLDGVVGQQALNVVLVEGVDDAQDRRDGSEDQDHEAPPELDARTREQVETDLEDSQDADLDHAAGHEGGHVGRRLGVRLGQPGVQRDDTGLCAESEEREDEARGGDGGSKVMRTEITEAEGTAHAVGHEQEARHDKDKAHVRDDEVEPTAPNGVLVLLDNDKEVARKGHELKGDQEPEHVVGGGDEHHRGDEGVHEETGATDLARVLIEVGQTVDEARKGED